MRLCAPIALAPKVIGRVENILISAAQVLADKEARFGKTSIDTEKVTFQTLVLVFCHNFLPYVDRCLRRVFPPATLTMVSSDAKFMLDLSKVHAFVPLKEIVLSKSKPVLDIQDDNVQYVVDRVSVIDKEIEESQKLPEELPETAKEIVSSEIASEADLKDALEESPEEVADEGGQEESCKEALKE